MTQMQSADSIWLHMEPEGESMHVSLMSVYDPGPSGSLTREDLAALVDARIVSRVPRFHQRLLRLPLSIDNPYWIDDSSFDLDRHISERTLIDPGDWRALLATGMRVHAEPMDPDRPLWDVTLVTGIDDVPDFATNSFAVVWRFHHAMVDGKAVLEIVSLLHDTTPHGGEAETGLLGRRRAEPRLSPSEIAVRAVAHLAGRPFDVANRVLRALPMIGETILSQRSLPQVAPLPAPRTRFNGRVGQQRRLGLVRFDLDRVRNLRRLLAGSTVNDIALTVVGGALRAYLLEVGELPVQSMTAACPISSEAPRRKIWPWAIRCRRYSFRCTPTSPIRSSGWGQSHCRPVRPKWRRTASEPR